MARQRFQDRMKATMEKGQRGKALADHLIEAEKTETLRTTKTTEKPSKASTLNKPSKQDKPDKPSNQGMIRKTFIIKPEYHEKIKALAYWERREITEIMDEILDSYFQGKTVKPVPEKRRG